MSALPLSELRIYDMHCHLDFADGAHELAVELANRSIGCLSVTVDPEGYDRSMAAMASCPNVSVAVGLHPWWVAPGQVASTQIEQFESRAARTRFIGEVGLDFSDRQLPTRDVQTTTFDRIVAACAQGGKVLSIHAVRSADAVLDVLERRGGFENNACIFHWFSGTSDQLQRAVKRGCYFSVGEGMLASRRGRAYAQAIPRGRLLLETDAPAKPGSAYDADAEELQLTQTLSRLAAVRDEQYGELLEHIAQTSRRLLGQGGPAR